MAPESGSETLLLRHPIPTAPVLAHVTPGLLLLPLQLVDLLLQVVEGVLLVAKLLGHLVFAPPSDSQAARRWRDHTISRQPPRRRFRSSSSR